MNLTTRFSSLQTVCFKTLQINNVSFISRSERHSAAFKNKSMHCYKTLYPWDNFDEFCKYIISCVEYNKEDLLVLNKPFGIKIHGHDKPGARPKSENQFIKPAVPECDFTIEDTLPVLQEHFKFPKLSIVKSTEKWNNHCIILVAINLLVAITCVFVTILQYQKYTSGIVLLSSSDAVTEKLQKSFQLAKLQRKPHLVFWAVTLGYPVVPYRQERVGIKFAETGKNAMRQPVIETDISRRACKLKKVYPVQVESRIISKNEELSTSLIEIATSSVRWHFVRVYASARMAPILGDILYCSRMKKLLGIPVKVSLSNESEFEHLPEKLSDVLELPRGTMGQLMIPTMLHLRSMILPDYHQKNQDYVVTANLSPHFAWTINRLNLLFNC